MIVLWLLLGCAEETDPCAGVKDLARSDGSFALTASEHGVGWGSDACLQCHQTWNTHNVDCVRSVELDLEAIRDAADFEDPATCVPCHGSNGVAWLDEDQL